VLAEGTYPVAKPVDGSTANVNVYIDNVYASTVVVNNNLTWAVYITGFTPGVASAVTAKTRFTANGSDNFSSDSNVYNFTVTKTPAPIIVAYDSTSIVKLLFTNIITPETTQVILVYMTTDPNLGVNSYPAANPSSVTSLTGGQWLWTSAVPLNAGTTYYFTAIQRYNASNVSSRTSPPLAVTVTVS
jgi:hypothetical protein